MRGGRQWSSHFENWARKAFDDFRRFKGYSIELRIEDLSEAEDIIPLIDMLQLFMLQVAKRNGDLYPPGTYVSQPFDTLDVFQLFVVVCLTNQLCVI